MQTTQLADGVRIVHNRLLGGWFVVRGTSDTPISGRFNSKEEAQQWLIDRKNARDDKSASRLSAICDRELARVGLAYQCGWGTDNGPEDSKGGTVWTYEIDEDEADEMTYVKARSVGTGERKEFTIKAAPISNIRQIVEAHAKAR
jgi:hypothetical protein